MEYQIGREPENLSDIALYCPFDKSAVLLTLPYTDENGIFPTIYWLSCPYLVREVSRLEDEGLVKELTVNIDANSNLKEKMMETHKRYAKTRIDLLSEGSKNKIKEISSGMYKVLHKSGVGGIMDKEGVKCLHTHLADFLASGDNPVGELVWEKLGWPSDCHICDKENIKNEK